MYPDGGIVDTGNFGNLLASDAVVRDSIADKEATLGTQR